MSIRATLNKLAVGETEAARLLSLTTQEFAELVDSGSLPRPELIGGKHPRWPVARLEAVLTGANLDEEFET